MKALSISNSVVAEMEFLEINEVQLQFYYCGKHEKQQSSRKSFYSCSEFEVNSHIGSKSTVLVKIIPAVEGHGN